MKEYIFGKSPTVNQRQIPVTINDPENHISRTHCKITLYDDNSLVIEDLGSSNGTYINGVRITNPCKISFYDSVTLADKIVDIKQYIKISVKTDNAIALNIKTHNDQINYAEWVTRLAQYLIDGLIIGGIFIIFSLITSAITSQLIYSGGFNSGSFLVFLLIPLIYIGLTIIMIHFYYVVPVSKTGQTIGAKVMKIQILDLETLDYPSKGKVWLRTIGYSFSGIIFCIGFLMPLWTEKKQALHDIIANTVVVNKN